MAFGWTGASKARHTRATSLSKGTVSEGNILKDTRNLGFKPTIEEQSCCVLVVTDSKSPSPGTGGLSS
jgi:hypothetical protein